MGSRIKVDGQGHIKLRDIFPHKDISSVQGYNITMNADGSITLKLLDGYYKPIKELPDLKKLICTKNLVRMTKDATNKCWNDAKRHVMLVKAVDEDEALEKYKAEIDEAYLRVLNRLSTTVLEAIILCDKRGKLHRADRTLASITTELANRALLNDSSRDS